MYIVKDLDKLAKEKEEIRKVLSVQENLKYNNELSWSVAWDHMGYCKQCDTDAHSEPIYYYGEIYAVECSNCGSNWAIENKKEGQ